MKILARLPNWLGDVVMSSAALARLQRRHPGAALDVVVKDGLAELAPLLPAVGRVHRFRPDRDGGWRGMRRFARRELTPQGYDLYVSFPGSFSSALLGFLAGIPARRGYRGELRSLLLSEALSRPQGRHRVDEYLGLVGDAAAGEPAPQVQLQLPQGPLAEPFSRRTAQRRVVLNIQSEATSRRLPLALGAAVGRQLLAAADVELVLTGTAKERPRSQELLQTVGAPERVHDWSGRTNLVALVQIVAGSDLVITTDSGLAHLANAVGTPELVFFGAGDPASTAPYNRERCVLLRDTTLACAPCVSNRCREYATPRCLEQFQPESIAAQALELLRRGR